MCDSMTWAAPRLLTVQSKVQLLLDVSSVTIALPTAFWSAFVTGGTSLAGRSWAVKTITSALAGRVIRDATAPIASAIKTTETIDLFIVCLLDWLLSPPLRADLLCK